MANRVRSVYLTFHPLFSAEVVGEDMLSLLSVRLSLNYEVLSIQLSYVKKNNNKQTNQIKWPKVNYKIHVDYSRQLEMLS